MLCQSVPCFRDLHHCQLCLSSVRILMQLITERIISASSLTVGQNQIKLWLWKERLVYCYILEQAGIFARQMSGLFTHPALYNDVHPCEYPHIVTCLTLQQTSHGPWSQKGRASRLNSIPELLELRTPHIFSEDQCHLCSSAAGYALGTTPVNTVEVQR